VSAADSSIESSPQHVVNMVLSSSAAADVVPVASTNLVKYDDSLPVISADASQVDCGTHTSNSTPFTSSASTSNTFVLLASNGKLSADIGCCSSQNVMLSPSTTVVPDLCNNVVVSDADCVPPLALISSLRSAALTSSVDMLANEHNVIDNESEKSLSSLTDHSDSLSVVTPLSSLSSSCDSAREQCSLLLSKDMKSHMMTASENVSHQPLTCILQLGHRLFRAVFNTGATVSLLDYSIFCELQKDNPKFSVAHMERWQYSWF
jgi:hypothetical protein